MAQLVADLARCRARLPEGQVPAAASGGVPAPWPTSSPTTWPSPPFAAGGGGVRRGGVRPAGDARARLEQALSDKGYPTALGENLRG